MSTQIGLFGGSFDPIHHGHLIAARSVVEQLELDRMILIPSARPPHKLGVALTAGPKRLAMVRLAIDGEPGMDASDVELTRTGPSYTFDTVREFQRQLGAGAALHWIIGTDSLADLKHWHRVAELLEACRIVTVARPGWDRPDLSSIREVLSPSAFSRLTDGILDTPRIDISATDIRRRVAAGRSIRFLVPDSVERYVRREGLYVDRRGGA